MGRTYRCGERVSGLVAWEDVLNLPCLRLSRRRVIWAFLGGADVVHGVIEGGEWYIRGRRAVGDNNPLLSSLIFWY